MKRVKGMKHMKKTVLGVFGFSKPKLFFMSFICFTTFMSFMSLDARQAGRGAAQDSAAGSYVIKPARVFDGEALHEGWAVLVRGQRIESAGPAAGLSAP